MMRPTLAALAAVLALAACDPVAPTTYYAEGVDLATRDADYAQCAAQALRDHPVRDEIRFTPRIYVPSRTSCTAAGACTTIPGYFEGGEPYTVDGNAGIRATATRGCMGERGYARVGLPYCAAETAIRPSVVMPPLADGTCLYRPDGRGPALVVNPV
ncbi:hypothetical protein [Roseicyclus persicicus]|uniref:Lipoprotein n=1 Tax=Roseicyclus persicicus TaxID=2650661 RepID=A0A7X6H1Q8_9RHOB|nr:hypothetical protein [Roseibacterium persicicum]NKX46442.1 hypothetical protein [Roseibacterium persicicum]